MLGGMTAIAYVDRKEERIPNVLLLVLLAGYPLRLFSVPVGESLLGALFGGGIFLAAYALSRGKIGMGDCKLMAVLGLYLGQARVAGVMLLSLLLAAVFGIVMIALRRMNRKSRLPFAPFVLAALLLQWGAALGKGEW